jgi:hypothetical protein
LSYKDIKDNIQLKTGPLAAFSQKMLIAKIQAGRKRVQRKVTATGDQLSHLSNDGLVGKKRQRSGACGAAAKF